jgi:hypothetical protein
LVDEAWTDRKTRPRHGRGDDLPWEPTSLGGGVVTKPLRGRLGVPSPDEGASRHSPWAADAAFLLRVPFGAHRALPFPRGPLELLVLSGRGTIDGCPWRRGVSAVGPRLAELQVDEDLTFSGRWFGER